MTGVLIIGATSAIAEATARLWAEAGCSLFLVGRQEARLKAVADDLATRGASSVGRFVLDMNEIDRHAEMLDAAETALERIDICFVAHGTLSDQQACQGDVATTLHELQTNALSTIALLTLVAQRFEQRGNGTVAVISSVAGDRGRQSNYVYGTAKAALDTFLEGLRQRLHKAGVRVVTIKPGFVDTPMTASFKKGPLWATPATVARRIERAIARGADVVYVPPFWRLIMLVIRSMPRSVFKRIAL